MTGLPPANCTAEMPAQYAAGPRGRRDAGPDQNEARPPASGRTSSTRARSSRPGSSNMIMWELRSKVTNRLRGASMRSK